MESKYWVLLFFLNIICGLLLIITISGIFYLINKKNDENLTLQYLFKKYTAPCLLFSTSILLLFILKSQYNYSIELLVLSTILLAGSITSAQFKNVFIFLFSFALIVAYILIPVILKLIYNILVWFISLF